MEGPSALRPAAFVFADDLTDPTLADNDQHHLVRVLRLRPGESVVVADGVGRWRPCAVRTVSAGAVELEPRGEVVEEPRPSPRVTVGFALTKGDRPELVVQKLTELGVDRIVPVAAQRSIVRWDDERSARHHGRLVTVAREAAMQARRPSLPVVDPIGPLDQVVAGGPFALCEAGGEAAPTLDVPALFVGPEGGWTEEELRHSSVIVGLGPTTLRAETATIAAGVLLCALRSATVRGK